MKKVLLLLAALPAMLFSQIKIKVVDEGGRPVSGAQVEYNNQNFITDDSGVLQVPLADQQQPLTVRKDAYSTFTKTVPASPKSQQVTILLRRQERETEIQEVVFQGKGKPKVTDLTSVEISAKEAQQVAALSGGVEGLLKTLPSVNSNAELSSQYMVRGGNYDENLIYINDIEIYRPFLIRNSLQEGLSIINPDMVQTVNFSAGGFEAKYGDKMSSALNVYYRQPTRNEISGEASLIGGRLTGGFASRDRKFTALVSGRYRNTNLVLNTLNEDTDFNPQYKDLQSYLTYKIHPNWKLSFVGYWSENTYEMIPKVKEVDFGSLQTPLKLSVFYDGKEDDQYRNLMGTGTIQFTPNKKWNFTLDAFAYQNREREYYTIASAYMLQTFDPVTGAPITSYDVGGQIDHARNDLMVKTYGAQFKTKFAPNVNTDIEAGLKIEKENLKDLTNEWQLIDSLGYSTPRDFVLPGQLNAADLKLKYQISGQNHIQPTRMSAYAQYSQKLYWGTNRVFVNAGVRASHWDFNDETIVSPRAQFAIKPDWEQDMLFRLSGGIYYQAPFYKEIKDVDGSFNSDIKSQRSAQIILANDYEFRMAKRPFKLTTELYYKKMDHLIPYYLDNVRIRYSGQNNAEGYAYGIDTRLFGEFVPGVDSWISASYARVYENINGQGNIPRPTDPRLRLSMFYQDYMPKFPSMRVNLTLVYANGLPSGTPVTFLADGTPDFNAAYQYQRTLPSYKRVDIGLSKVFVDQNDNKVTSGFFSNFRELSLGVQIYNAFNINNTVANQWVNDVSSGYNYPVPVRLTGRFFNVKLDFKL
ncbi:TonB-dependent receptor plug domain-containing protein [Chryseobacterium salipaludis]|uniref:TonB-dependent receptor plug domain-containing protein n=1 Tax=Chryseobacterium TaxID=59732 RepID=UPI001FF4BC42|nr:MULTISPECIES: TonB-dependent receptor plug domain-containing protein [Chryseobacterium]MCJ8496668.1 TonB-dependent receptor plug domain-containing protein [Chryseobacterium salipaludis]MCX3296149.1 TonB-dependent receptor plug domain-containing protein [Planobacterium sp. JC490]